MAETAVQSDKKVAQGDLIVREDLMQGIKKELDVLVKPEPHECVVCVVRSNDGYDIYATTTSATGISLHSFLSKFTTSDIAVTQYTKFICKSCHDLINVLEQAEIEYLKLKETFESIISKNPLFGSPLILPIRLESVKNEIHMGNNEDHQSWDCSECGILGQGGKRAAAAHEAEVHTMSQDEAFDMVEVKKEDTSDGSQNFNNGFDDSLIKMEFEDHYCDDDDDSWNYMLDEEVIKEPKKKRDVKPQFMNLITTTIRSQDVEMHKENSLDDSSLASPATPLSIGGNRNPYNSSMSATPSQERSHNQTLTPASSKKKKESKPKIVTGYILYLSEARKVIVANNPGCTFGEISRIVGKEWSSLPAATKQSWQERAKCSNHRTRLLLCGSNEETMAKQADEELGKLQHHEKKYPPTQSVTVIGCFDNGEY